MLPEYLYCFRTPNNSFSAKESGHMIVFKLRALRHKIELKHRAMGTS